MELKFRLWDDTLCRYIFDACDLTIEGIAKNDFPSGINWYQLHWEQYTGLKDKNGTEIYEGDILSGLGVVKMVHGIFEPVAYFKESALEVVGNIHQNPELLDNIEH